jgi:hypothetical protein
MTRNLHQEDGKQLRARMPTPKRMLKLNADSTRQERALTVPGTSRGGGDLAVIEAPQPQRPSSERRTPWAHICLTTSTKAG